MMMKTKILLYLLVITILDATIPIPLSTLLLIYVFMEKPGWFYNVVMKIYQE